MDNACTRLIKMILCFNHVNGKKKKSCSKQFTLKTVEGLDGMRVYSKWRRKILIASKRVNRIREENDGSVV